MRVLVVLGLLVAAYMLAGWPGHWTLTVVSFLAGVYAARRQAPALAQTRRGGYVHEPSRNHRTLTERVYDYSGTDTDDAAELHRDATPTGEMGA